MLSPEKGPLYFSFTNQYVLVIGSTVEEEANTILFLSSPKLPPSTERTNRWRVG